MDFHTYYVSKVSILVHNMCTTRSGAVKAVWRNEYNNVKEGKQSISRIWNQNERNELLLRGKVHGYEGHHMKSVKGYPNLAGDPNNIQFLARADHLRAHGGNFRNITHGRFIP